MSNTTYQDLQRQIQALEQEAAALRAQADAERASQLKGVIEEARATIAEYSITAKELGLSNGGATKTKAKPKSGNASLATRMGAAVEYRGPNGETWMGGSRGRKPAWLSTALANGRQLSDFVV